MDLLSSEDQDNIYRDIMFHVDYIPTFVFVEKVFILSTKSTLKSGLECFYFEIHRALSEIPANLPGQFSLWGQIFLHWAVATLKGLCEFQSKKKI